MKSTFDSADNDRARRWGKKINERRKVASNRKIEAFGASLDVALRVVLLVESAITKPTTWQLRLDVTFELLPSHQSCHSRNETYCSCTSCRRISKGKSSKMHLKLKMNSSLPLTLLSSLLLAFVSTSVEISK
jgi:hypothetical protein